MTDSRQLEALIWRIADGRASDADLATFADDERASVALLDRLIVDAEDDIDSVSNLTGEEREQVVADFIQTLESLLDARDRLRPDEPRRAPFVAPPRRGSGNARPNDATRNDATRNDATRKDADFDDADFDDLIATPIAAPEPGEVELQASWSAGQVVVWAAGRGTPAENNEALSSRLERIDGPPLGWQVHSGFVLPGGHAVEALSISMKDALGWLAHVGGGQGAAGVGPSVLWLARVAVEGVRLVTRGALIPRIKATTRADGHQSDVSMVWSPALLDATMLAALSSSMPGTVTALGGTDNRATTIAVLTAVAEAIVAEAIARMDLPAQPPAAMTPVDFDDTLIARLDGGLFRAPVLLATDTARRFEQWSGAVTASKRQRLIVELAAPDSGGVWLASVFAALSAGKLVPIDVALRAESMSRLAVPEWKRLGRAFPAVDRGSVRRRGQVALSQDEAWEFMTVTGPMLAAVGFEVRAPELSRRKARPSLRLFAEASSGSTVGAHQLSNVAWSVLFDDVELTPAEVAKLARQARPLVQSRGRWIEVDRVDLQKAAAALAERESITQLTGAEILRQSIGLDSSGLSGGVVVHGNSWANDIVQRASEASTSPVARPDGFVGELRTYQADALGWIGFLDAAQLGGCLALDMGLGKTPTVLAHIARTAGTGAALVIAPAAVVGNWAAEAARFAPQLNVVVHHGADRSEAAELEAEIAGADIVITTYATAVRDVEELSAHTWARIVLDEAQAIKNPTSETSIQLRRIPARTRLALTGTPIENGLGDLWAILDFTNPGLVGSRPSFLAQMSGDGEHALRALNGILLFRRTKSEPEVAAELPDKIDELDHCTMTTEQIGLYQAVLDDLLIQVSGPDADGEPKKGAVLAAITALKQICNHPAAYRDDGQPLAGRSGKLARLEEIVESVFAADERILVFTHFATWGRRLATHLTQVTGIPIDCYDGSLARGARDRMITQFQQGIGPGALVLSLKAGGTGLNLTSANHVVLYDRWWNPAVEDQARDRAWRIGQSRTVISHRLVCPGTVDERVEEVVAGKRHIANFILPQSSSLADLNTDQLRLALGLRENEILDES